MLAGRVSAYEKNVIKSLNFKLYYSSGGETIAKNIITCAENNLGSFENFLGTRLVEKIDIFLLESSEYENLPVYQRNGTIILTNSEIKIFYKGNISDAYYQLKKQLCEILIYDMLFGNTIKDRLRNNREVNIQDWFIKGLALFVAQKKFTNSGILADYFENRVNLNFNILSEKETEEIGFSVVKFINDSFGSAKLKQILFYTRLSGNTDFAFKIVLNKSSEKLIAKWFFTEKYYYLKNSNLRLPNEPEPLNSKLKNSEILELKFNSDGQSLDILIKSEYGIEIYNYNFENRITNKIFYLNTKSDNYIFNFAQASNIYAVSICDGFGSRIIYLKNGKIIKNIRYDFSNIYKILSFKNNSFLILAQKDFKTDLYLSENLNEKELTNITQGEFDFTDFAVSNNDEIYILAIASEKNSIINIKSKKTIYSSGNSIAELNAYRESMLSFLSFENGINSGMIVNLLDTSQYYRVTNYNRSINEYDYNNKFQKVVELINYDKKNYVVISDATIKEIYPNKKDSLSNEKDSLNVSLKSTVNADSGIYFITGFEYRKGEITQREYVAYNKMPVQVKFKEYKINKYEFKPRFMKIAFSNETFHSSEFANFFPIEQGLNNGANIILGCGIIEIYKKYTIEGNVRQPLRNKGLDMDFLVTRNEKNGNSGLKFYYNNFQEELYNYPEKYSTIEFKYLRNKKINHKILYSFEAGFRQDLNLKTSVSEENIKKAEAKIVQPFALNYVNYELFKKNGLNYKSSLNFGAFIKINKPINTDGFNNNLKFQIIHDQVFFRIIKLSTQLIIATSAAKQKTVFLLGGQSNWIKPVYGLSNMHDSIHTLMYSATEDFEGFPLNYLSGTSYSINKIKVVLPLNPILSYYSFNQNVFKYLSLKGILNIGTVWYGKNPFSITNPENRTVTETGSMTIINYTYKNPLLWSWCAGINSVLLGYSFGVDYSMGYNESGNIGKYIGFTIGKEI